MATDSVAEYDTIVFTKFLEFDLGSRLEHILNYFGFQSTEQTDIMGGLNSLIQSSNQFAKLANNNHGIEKYVNLLGLRIYCVSQFHKHFKIDLESILMELSYFLSYLGNNNSKLDWFESMDIDILHAYGWTNNKINNRFDINQFYFESEFRELYEKEKIEITDEFDQCYSIKWLDLFNRINYLSTIYEPDKNGISMNEIKLLFELYCGYLLGVNKFISPSYGTISAFRKKLKNAAKTIE